MDDFVYLDEMEAMSRDGWSELRGHPFGPAGTSAVDLPDGSVLEVDHADPGQLVSLTVDGDLERSSLARDLLGPERFDWTCAQLDAQRAVKPGGKRLKAQVPGSPNRWAQSIPRAKAGGGLADALGAAVLSADMSADESFSPLLRLAAGVEFLVTVDDRDMSNLLGPAADLIEAEVFRVSRLVGPEDFDVLGNRAVKALFRLGAMLAAVRRERPSLDLPLRRIADLIEHLPGDRRIVGNAGGFSRSVRRVRPLEKRVSMYEAPGQSFDQEFAPDFDGVAASPPPEDFLEVEMPEAGTVVVRVSRQHDGKWARVLRVAGLVPLALVPLLEIGILLEGTAVVPPDLEVRDLLVEVVDPDEAVTPERPLALVRGAVEAGRAAALFERLDRLRDAASAWRESGRLWAEAGDSRRSRLAWERATVAESGHTRGAVSASVADELLAASMVELPDRF